MSVAPPAQRVMTATPKAVLRRSVFWIGAAVFALLVALVGMLFAGAAGESDPLSATNPAPNGAKAVVEVLRQRGVDVTVATSLTQATDAMDRAGADDTTLLYFDPDGLLDADQRAEVFSGAGHVVAVDPSFDQLADLSPDIAQAGSVSGEADAGCDDAVGENAGSITSDGSGFRYTGTGDAVECFGAGDGVYSLVRVQTDGALVSVTGARDALSNEFVSDRGNAAFALNMLGERANLVWYIPTVADLADDAPPTLGELSPDWVLPVTALAILTALAAAFWRGRRFGPLVVENLPVTVRANETMRGRARLYEKSSARLRALDSLRIGAVERLARACGLSRVATVDDVVAAVAAVTRIDPAEVRRVLVDAAPASDRDLVRLSDDLLTLERTVATSVTPT